MIKKKNKTKNPNQKTEDILSTPNTRECGRKG